MIIPVVMAGGTGSRLWPKSRKLHPKQFLNLNGRKSMLQETLSRLRTLDIFPPIIVANEEHRFLVAEQVRQEGIENATILLEPEVKNTAPAVAIAALSALEENPESLLLILAADHVIDDVEEFSTSVATASRLAKEGMLVTFGVTPSHAETGFGYIQRGEKCDLEAYRVKKFVEKPSSKKAKEFLESGEFYWNSGIFLFKARRYIEELSEYQPKIVECCRSSMSGKSRDLDFFRIDAASFGKCPAESIDYAVMEKTKHASVVSFGGGWNDVGSWSALWDISDKSPEGNVVSGDVLTYDSSNMYVQANQRLVATVGVSDLVVVETSDAVLVANKERSQDVKFLVDLLKEGERKEYIHHREVYRPWGMYDSIGNGERYQVKKITVKPGAKLSVQLHHHRAEHWIVVSGMAKITNGDESYFLGENESTYIPVCQIHSLENPGVIPLEIIEVQSGSYLGEDDIVRFDDIYGRDQ
ncbi:mannose-1-phosphate guanylyltransferase/mannose-6-phosphate isomerase [Halomonas sp.]|uniref:mannose-1-phosphate guanylyltransferase/mannose-6-phosphate isomerase n=1 Tax=Halomonas sp. TaxID=1486246 RepID=UPI00257FC533|nr:mannose-1-phosphate guanylyltransferase/mannose-6-phosphate isomerase [Halomonas sp.]MCJ8286914.1 mannose-1-phosphate guanylyltransferase/mannose-6-phosphate isomerase [Halomonas sp.]NQY71629.1 mannose-1-phosphate guanylyltransferase/mannose-6-phosphate isomerase [Halomonas sp.]